MSKYNVTCRVKAIQEWLRVVKEYAFLEIRCIGDWNSVAISKFAFSMTTPSRSDIACTLATLIMIVFIIKADGQKN